MVSLSSKLRFKPYLFLIESITILFSGVKVVAVVKA
tara:strand:+ start:1341 stop:1448 length:108 start_codon:yes stop_codon:yes gene_type:complete